MTDQIKSGGEHWSRQGIVARIISAMVEANGKVQAVPAGRAADDILALLAPALSRTPAKAGEDGLTDVLKTLTELADAILSEAPADAAALHVFTDCEGKVYRITMDQLRALSTIEEPRG